MSRFKFDRSTVSVTTLDQEPSDLSYWNQQSPATRLAGVEFLRRQFYRYGDTRPELRRLLEVTQS